MAKRKSATATKPKPVKATKAKATTTRATGRDRTRRALTAALRLHDGEKLTQAEKRDLTAHQKQTRNEIAGELLAAIPKGIYCQMAGRQQRTIDEQADRYDLPIDGPTIDLFAAIKSYHDLITANARVIRAADDAEAITAGDVDEMTHAELQMLKMREEITKLQRGNESLAIKVTKERGDTIDRSELRHLLGWLSTRLEGFGQQLRRSDGGEDAQKCLNEFIEHLAAECESGVLQV
ncbi:hypothetical protein [Allorhodopirellula heiligendammensis]|uniref:Uncharacterized protein n=1 Tax=Allorhodopirellula heiligendammensis TaxID=2714739 RepID=A0A5C6BVR1_9BACT|nr:hypothetical protein [Allorhodopirellula heiligendammensis]TWU15972.1 hypothetical protein Poly21_31760 [Allorhodopirellula heiligendammensis]